MVPNPPDNPAGVFTHVETYSEGAKEKLVDIIKAAPAQLRQTTKDLSAEQLDTNYKNWTARQIVHHLADSHLHSMIRFKWALTEENPTIKAYEEADWVRLADNKWGDIQPALAMLDGLHEKWIQVICSMTKEQFSRTFQHPQSGETVSLWLALNYYAWHGRHHTAQIEWLRDQHGWKQPSR